MSVTSFLKKWLYKEIEDWGGQTSPSYNEFQSDYKKLLKTICREIGFSLHIFHANHYCFTAVLEDEEKRYYYISIPDVRHFSDEWRMHILYRTMEHEMDWHGGYNWYSNLRDLGQNLLKLKAERERTLK